MSPSPPMEQPFPTSTPSSSTARVTVVPDRTRAPGSSTESTTVAPASTTTPGESTDPRTEPATRVPPETRLPSTSAPRKQARGPAGRAGLDDDARREHRPAHGAGHPRAAGDQAALDLGPPQDPRRAVPAAARVHRPAQFVEIDRWLFREEVLVRLPVRRHGA